MNVDTVHIFGHYVNSDHIEMIQQGGMRGND